MSNSISLLSTVPSLIDRIGRAFKHATPCTCSESPSAPSASSTATRELVYVPFLPSADEMRGFAGKGTLIGVLLASKGGDSVGAFEASAMEEAARLGVWEVDPRKWTSVEPTPSSNTTTSTHATALNTFALAGLRSIFSTTSPCSDFTFHVLEKAPFTFRPLSDPHKVSLRNNDAGSSNIPSRQCWDELWKTWDLITLGMIPEDMILQKPIELRHKCLFYIGHIPTFLDMMLCKTLGGEPSEPKYFWDIFERGIDPHVDDPDHCHNHSAVPTCDSDWPTLTTIISFRDQVRARLNRLYDALESGERKINLAMARTLVMTFEHEAFHVETILYMLIQRAGTGTRPPPGFTKPFWSHLVERWDAGAGKIRLPLPVLGPTTITMGHDDSEADDYTVNGHIAVEGPERIVDREFGWDNESPARRVKVGKFKAEWSPVTNAQFERFWRSENSKGNVVAMPASWVLEGEAVMVRTVYGPVSMDIAKHWAVLTSYDDLLKYARAKGGRLPTEPELRLFLDTYDVGYDGGANIGFRNWHPVPPSMGLGGTDGKGSNGGVWEWTSTAFATHEGLVPTQLFTGYSTDFFDGVHHVALGASYATLPRLTRRTLKNFYQHNYPFPWVGARVVYDVV